MRAQTGKNVIRRLGDWVPKHWSFVVV